MYHLTHYAYCGMSVPITDNTDKETARQLAADTIRRRRRQGFPVAVIKPGISWEILEPDNCALVPDSCGILKIHRDTFECRECGTEHDDRESAAECCAEVYCDAE